ncbi:MAG TPA: endonuclease/exonuclease/phosphatase family protein, partial [Oscillospiraceae bacterium]|nr:endonuclease/exonuclease/phosphatase family protein [Oscillospiraceae bacterium]
MKKIVSMALALILLSPLSLAAAPSHVQEMQLNVLSYNVSGIPVLGDYQGTQRELRGKDRAAKIGELINEHSGCDIIGVQEAFTHYDRLSENLSHYPYFTNYSGRVPHGDGLGIFSKFPIYNVKHTKWDLSYGVLSGSSDKLAQKGFLYSLVELAPGVYIDFYVLHADAGKDSKSVEARADNFRQLAEAIQNTPGNRAVIALGDYNFEFQRNFEDDLYTNLIEATGLKDAWIELHNGGRYNYDDGFEWNPSVFDSLDRVLYKSGEGVKIEAKTY